MRKRPRLSVTTILANGVGSSFVSAITQTPASGPCGLATTPPMSLEPTPASTLSDPIFPAHAANNAAAPAAARNQRNLVFIRLLFARAILYLASHQPSAVTSSFPNRRLC